jgi:hypothetical protein
MLIYTFTLIPVNRLLHALALGMTRLTALIFLSGNLFASDVKGVRTPLPLPSEKLPSGKALDLIIEAFSTAEYKRGAKNILSCTGYIDFRDIDDVTEVEGRKETKAHRRFRITLRTGEKLLMQVGPQVMSVSLNRSLIIPIRRTLSHPEKSGFGASTTIESTGEQSNEWSKCDPCQHPAEMIS